MLEQALAIVGAIGTGLTVGWLAEPRLTVSCPRSTAATLAALVVAALCVWPIAGPGAAATVAGAALVGLICSHTWRLDLGQRRPLDAENNT